MEEVVVQWKHIHKQENLETFFTQANLSEVTHRFAKPQEQITHPY